MNTKNLIEAVKFQVSVKPQDDFMREVAEGLETLYEENNRQKAEIDKLTCDYGCYKVSATDVVEQLKAEIEALISGQKTLQKALTEKDAEIERLREAKEQLEVKSSEEIHSLNAEIRTLKKTNEAYTRECKRIVSLIPKARAEAVKEFAERLKKRFESWSSYSGALILANVDVLVKEKAGDTE